MTIFFKTILTLIVLLTISHVSFPQPANDICSNRTILGSLPTPGTCSGGLQDGTPITSNGTTINANPESPYPYVSGSCVGSPNGTSSLANDVWYQFTTTGTTVNLSVSGLSKSNVVVWQGTCSALTSAVACLGTGNSGAGSLSFNTVAGNTFYVQVSSDKTATSSNGNFTLSIDNDIDCDNCLRSSSTTANPAPVNGSYIPGQVVQFCYTVTDFQKQNSNWIHGIQLTFGAGWTGTATNIIAPTACQDLPGNGSNGNWNYYPTGIGTVNGQSWGEGFYFTAPNVTSPELGFGDGGKNGCNWTFCWSLTVSPTCNPGSDLSVTVNTSGDGESGGWISPACTPDNPIITLASGLPLPIVTNSNDSPVCVGQDVNLTATTTETGITYSWTGPNGFTSSLQNPTLTAITTLDTGDYIVGITKNGCTGYDTTTVTILSVIDLSPTANTPLCENDTLNLTSQTVPSGVYTWTGPNGFTSSIQNPSINGIPVAGSGNYIVSATSLGCTGTDTISVVVNPIPVTTANSNSPVCENDTLNLTATNVIGAAYAWTGPNGFTSATQNPNINGVSLATAGDYIVTTTLNGCTFSDTVTVLINSVPTTIANSNSPVCENDTLNLTATNLIGATYAWTGPNGFSSPTQNPNINGVTLPANGDYIVTTSLNGCTFNDTTTVVINPIPTTIANSNSPVCENDTLNLTATNVIGATYAWTGPNGFTSTIQNPNINGVTLPANGDYIVTTTLNGCTFDDTTTVVINPAPTTTANSNSPVCENDTLNLTATNLIGATYTWTGPNGFTSAIQNPNINGVTLPANGDYIVTTSLNGCTFNDTTTVVINPIPTTIANSNSPVCENDTLNLTATNVIGATYAWTGPNGFTSTIQNPNINGVTLPATGNYIVTTTLNGCTFDDTTTVVINPAPTTTANSNSPVCENDTLNLTATNVVGATYSWTGPNGFTSAIQNPNINGVTISANGDYIMTTSLNGCTFNDTATVVINPIPITTAGGNNVLCVGNTLNLTATNVVGATYFWTGPNGFTSAVQNPSISSVTLSMSGNYIAEVLLNGCSSSDTINVVIDVGLTVSASANTPVCEYDTVNLAASNISGATYSWAGPNGYTSSTQNDTITNLNISFSGDYIVSADLSGCIGKDTISVLVNPTPITTASSNSPVCENDTLNLTTSNVVGATYSWAGPNGFTSVVQNPNINDVTLASNGNYIVTATLNGCIFTDTTAVVINTIPLATLGNNSPICEGEMLNLTATNIAGAAYAWTGPNGFSAVTQNPSINPISLADSGNYILTVSLNGCSFTDTTVAIINPNPVFTIGSNTPVCENDTLNLTSTNVTGGIYTWAGSNGFSSALQTPSINSAQLADSGDYILSVSLNGCVINDTTLVNINPIPLVNATSNTPICEGGTVVLNTTNIIGATYLWSGPNSYSNSTNNPSITNATNNMSGNYLLVTTLSGCNNYDTVFVTVDTIESATTIPPNAFCYNGIPTNLAAVNPGGIWSGNGITSTANGTFNPLIAGTGNHTITYISKGSCPDTQTVVINVTAPQNTQIILDNTEGCPPLTVNGTTTNTGNLNCNWFVDNESVSDLCSGFNYTFLNSGCYDIKLEAIDSNGCSNTKVFTDTVCIYPQPIASFSYPNKKYTVINNIVNFSNNSTDANNYLWDFMGTGTSTLSDPTYKLPTQTGSYEVCLAAISIDGCVDSVCQYIEILDAPYFNVPNAFTPNNDGLNDLFSPVISDFNIEEYDLYIFNRWGNLIFSTKDTKEGWDGTHKGEAVEIGSYVWRVRVKEYDDVEIQSFVGHVNLIK